MKMKGNKDVPRETIMRHVLLENGKLKSEVDYLKNELEKRDKMIAAFKKWQSKVCEYKWRYWLTNGVALAEEKPDKNVLHQLVKFLSSDDYYKKFTKKYELAYKKACENGDLLLDLVN